MPFCQLPRASARLGQAGGGAGAGCGAAGAFCARLPSVLAAGPTWTPRTPGTDRRGACVTTFVTPQSGRRGRGTHGQVEKAWRPPGGGEEMNGTPGGERHEPRPCGTGPVGAGDRASPEAVIATQRCRLPPLNLCVPWRGRTEASPQVAEKPGVPRLPCPLPTGGSAPESQPETESWRLVSTQGPEGARPSAVRWEVWLQKDLDLRLLGPAEK